LRILDLSGCDYLTHIAPIAGCVQLTCVTLSGCEALESLGGIEWCPSLSRLCVSGCRALQSLHPLKSLQNLAFLDAQGCYQLRDVSALDTCPNLAEVTLQHCINLELARFTGGRLRTLNVIHCPALYLDVAGCATLTNLHANQSSWLTDLSNFPNNLQVAFFSWCFSLSDVCAASGWYNLQVLDLEDCTQLQRFELGAGVNPLPFLRELILSGCTALEEAPFLNSLKALTELHMANCVKLHAVDLAHCENLLTLDITAREFVDFPILPIVNRITQLDWSFSDTESLLPLVKCTQLESLFLEGCLVTDFAPLAHIALKNLDVSRNWKLTSLTSLKAFNNLQQVTAELCPSLDVRTCSFLNERLRRN